MKMTPVLKKARENMDPGIITAEGFLGSDKRSLSTIIDEDAQVMRRLDIDPVEVAGKISAPGTMTMPGYSLLLSQLIHASDRIIIMQTNLAARKIYVIAAFEILEHPTGHFPCGPQLLGQLAMGDLNHCPVFFTKSPA